MVAPVIAEHYENHTFPYEIIRQMGKMGLFGLPFPESVGGMGGDYFALCLALEELARVDSSVAITLEAAISLGAMPIYRFGTDEQKAEWLPKLISGEALAAFGLTEPGFGSDAGGSADPRGARRVDATSGSSTAPRRSSPTRGTDITSLVTVAAVTGANADGSKELSTIIVPSRYARLHRRARLLQGRLVRVGHPRAATSTTAGCRRPTCSARAAAASRSSWRRSTRAGSRSRRWPPGWPRAASTSR